MVRVGTTAPRVLRNSALYNFWLVPGNSPPGNASRSMLLGRRLKSFVAAMERGCGSLGWVGMGWDGLGWVGMGWVEASRADSAALASLKGLNNPSSGLASGTLITETVRRSGLVLDGFFATVINYLLEREGNCP